MSAGEFIYRVKSKPQLSMLTQRRRQAARNATAMERAAYRRMTEPHDCEQFAIEGKGLFGEGRSISCDRCGAHLRNLP